MIGYIRGKVAGVLRGKVLVEVNGVGYEVQMPVSQLDRLPVEGEELQVYTHLIIRDDTPSLYGFLDLAALNIFKMLLEVSGVGPRLALNILSVVSPEELLNSISQGNSARLRAVHGVGKKTAARICIDLKEKALKCVQAAGIEPGTSQTSQGRVYVRVEDSIVADAVSALLNLGYRDFEARNAVSRAVAQHGDSNIDRLIKAALQMLSRTR